MEEAVINVIPDPDMPLSNAENEVFYDVDKGGDNEMHDEGFDLQDEETTWVEGYDLAVVQEDAQVMAITGHGQQSLSKQHAVELQNSFVLLESEQGYEEMEIAAKTLTSSGQGQLLKEIEQVSKSWANMTEQEQEEGTRRIGRPPGSKNRKASDGLYTTVTSRSQRLIGDGNKVDLWRDVRVGESNRSNSFTTFYNPN
ncbi:hypothetical protein IFM89_031613 [Coptis chinensis]|uniref:Uncharacterized protein n=1 Tax=Coptis chinensis TaxID=261450 RepID=A0A835H8U8_9MAGN|nr:hypothetical protein IFM89_031613 [Coptis chinensis]